MKKSTIFIVLVVIIALAGFFIYQNLGGWIRTQAEKVASDAAGVNVAIGAINVSFAEKTITVSGIKVDNPKGFSSSKAITLGNITATADVLSRDKIVIKEVVATGEVINLENNADKINLRELLNGIQARSAAKGGKPSPSDMKAPKVIIKELRIEQGDLNSSLALLGKKSDNKLTIPQIRMTNLGDDKSSNNASEVAGKIIAQILNKAISAAAQQGMLSPANLKGSVKDLKGNLKGLLGK